MPAAPRWPRLARRRRSASRATRAGIVMGTVAYMSPEQASGSLVDKRSDIWAFGVVLFEMLAGRRLFEGETTSHTMADVLRADIDWNRLPASTPVPIRRLLERCLERDRKRRLQAIGEARIIIDDYLAHASPSGSRSVAVPVIQARPSSPGCHGLLRPCSVVALLGALALLWQQRGARRRASPCAPTSRSRTRRCSPTWARASSCRPMRRGWCTSRAPRRYSSSISAPSISSMGRSSRRGTRARARRINRSSRRTDSGSATSRPSEMRKVPVSGGTPLTLCKVTRSRGASWAPDGTIIFAPTPSSGLFRVSAAGGEPQPLTTLDKAEEGSHAPVAAGSTRRQGRDLHVAHAGDGGLRQRHDRSAHAGDRPAQGPSEGRILRQIRAVRASRVREQGGALCRAVRPLAARGYRIAGAGRAERLLESRRKVRRSSRSRPPAC